MSGAAALAIPLAPMIGREADLAEVVRVVGRHAGLATIVGPAGVGKTRLSLHAAGELRAAFAEAILLVPLAAVETTDVVLPTIAQRLEIADDGTPLVDRIARRLGESSCALLVLDNLEHLPGIDGVIAALLAASPGLAILATSRRAVGITGECVVPLAPLPMPEPGQRAAELAGNPAVRLVVARCDAFGARVTEPDLPAIAAVCAHLDGLPLALELAAARVPTLGAAGVLAQLRGALPALGADALGADRPTDDARHATLQGAIRWSYDLLDPPHRALFRRLSIFVGGFTVETAESIGRGRDAASAYVPPPQDLPIVGGRAELMAVSSPLAPLPIDPVEGVRTLLDVNLLRFGRGGDGEPRYDMLETIRAFGLAEVEAHGERAELEHGRATAMLMFSSAGAASLWRSRGTVTLWRRLADELPNLRAAMAWASLPEHDAATTALRMAGHLWYFLQLSGLTGEARGWLRRGLALDGGLPWARLQAMWGLGFVSWMQGDDAAAETVLTEALGDADDGPPTVSRGACLFVLSLVRWRQGRIPEMAALLHASRATYAAMDDTGGLGLCDLALGVLARLSGETAVALSTLERAFASCEAIGYDWGMATARYYAGEAVHDGGDAQAAARLIGEGLTRYRDLADPWGSGTCIAGLAVLAVERGQPRRAARLFGAAFGLCERAGVFIPPTDLDRYRTTAAALEDIIGDDPFREGRGWPTEQAVAEAVALAGEVARGDRAVAEVELGVGPAFPIPLSPAEAETLEFFCRGLRVKEVAEHCFVTPKAIYDRLDAIKTRAGIVGNNQLLALGKDRGYGRGGGHRP